MKRIRGDGSISRYGKRWRAQLVIGNTAEGKLIRRSVSGKTRQEAREKLDELKAQHRQGASVVLSANVPMSVYLTKWLDEVVKPNRELRTYTSYRGAVRNHILPHIGHVKLNRLSVDHVDELLRKLLDAGAGDRIRQLAFRVLNIAMNRAVKKRHISFNPCYCADRPRVKPRDVTPLTPEQVGDLVKVLRADDRWEMFFFARAADRPSPWRIGRFALGWYRSQQGVFDAGAPSRLRRR